MLEIREEQKRKLDTNPDMEIGAATSINLTMLKGGLQVNIVPPELHAIFDIRIAPDWDLEEFRRTLTQICAEAGPGVTWGPTYEGPLFEASPPTLLTSDNIWWKSFKAAADQLDLKLTTRIFPGRTDAIYLRQVGVAAFGFSPMNNTPVLLHDHDEYLNENVFLRGITIYARLLEHLSQAA